MGAKLHGHRRRGHPWTSLSSSHGRGMKLWPDLLSPHGNPTGEIPARLTGGTCVPYGLREWGDLFTATAIGGVDDIQRSSRRGREQYPKRRSRRRTARRHPRPRAGGTGLRLMLKLLSVYLAFVVDYATANYWSLNLRRPPKASCVATFARQVVPNDLGLRGSSIRLGTPAEIVRRA